MLSSSKMSLISHVSHANARYNAAPGLDRGAHDLCKGGNSWSKNRIPGEIGAFLLKHLQ